eukprot:jgi/Mesen1/3849/ME000207S02863
MLGANGAHAGPLSFPEVIIVVDFVVLVLGWVSRSVEDGVPGWEGFLAEVDDGTFGGESILNWDMCRNLPWDIILLLGGGFAMSEGVAQSGLAQFVGAHMHALRGLPTLLLVPAVALVVVVTTEFSSNTATATVFLPLLAQVALSIERHPLLLMLPATLACSFAFMLPIATPPNAIAYATGMLRMLDMALPGAVLNAIGMGLLTLFVPTLGAWVFSLDAPPEQLTWMHANSTSAAGHY